MRIWPALVAAGLVLLSGCGTVEAPPAGLSADELSDRRQFLADSYWSSTGLSDDLRPPPRSVTELSIDDWAPAWVKCMNVAGFDQYIATEGGYQIQGDMTERSDAELLAAYVCDTSFEIDGQYDGWFNARQLDYVYDYYQDTLVPCLEVLGYELDEPPTRALFTELWGGWHPYYGVKASQYEQFYSDDRVPLACPAVPVGITDPGYALLWEQQP